ncbi:conserved domain protein [ [[Propionibacterium] namnetense SK182B-JCVI]|uniref:Conserved domain protein n=1 Tax=[Propionibacterium] namnetense SK182B-JCVI TaxID=1051006 RepID=F9NT82_9ACTN|nr:conserved domain protein [ [[Propionibacterium] namnetense SK182B-JCVI]
MTTGLIIAVKVAAHVVDSTALRVIGLSVFIVIISWNPNASPMH